MSRFRVTCALLAAGLLGPLVTLVDAPGVRADEGFCSLTWAGQDLFVWNGATGDDQWTTIGNWEDGNGDPKGRWPDLDAAAQGYVCIDAAHDDDTEDEIVYLVDRTYNSGSTSPDKNSAMVQAIDVLSGTLSINNAGKLLLYGDQATRPSYIRSTARFELVMGWLGGSGVLNMDGTMQWSPQQFSSSMSSSCVPMGILPQYCPPPGITEGPGRLNVGGTMSIEKLVDDGLNRGVNLNDRYQISVSGDLRIVGKTYLAQSDGTSIEITPDGMLTFAGDGDVYQGFVGPAGLGTFQNDGTVRKTAGTGTSSINTAYSGAGEVVVAPGKGSITTPGGFPAPVSVAPGESAGTWHCDEPPAGTPYSDCAFDTAADKSVTSPTDKQAARITVADTAPTDATIEIRETTTQGTLDLQPQIEISNGGLDADDVSEVGFEFSKLITGIPDKPNVRIFRRAGAANWREVPRCKDDGGSPFARGVTACVRGDVRDRADHQAVRVTVLTTTPRGRWVLRRASDEPPPVVRRVAVRDNGTFDFLGSDLPPNWEWFSRLDLFSADGTHCGTRVVNTWSVHRQLLVPEAADDHAVGWWPSDTGEARGFEVPVGDLADLGAFAIRLRAVQGELRGFARVVRRESATVTWEGTAELVAGDAEPITGNAPWRRVQGAVLDYSWQRLVNGVPDGAPTVATIEDFLAVHPTAKSGGDPDTVGFAFGCTGEQPLMNELTVQKVTKDEPIHWDLEAPPAVISSPGDDLGFVCQLTRNGWPNVVSRDVDVDAGVSWQARKVTDTGLGAPFDSGVGPGTFDLTLPKEPGQFILETLPSTDRRAGIIAEALRYKVVPKIKLLKITKTKEARVGQRIRLRARVVPRSVVRQRPLPLALYVVYPGRGKKLVKAPSQRVSMSVRDGVVTATFRTRPKEGSGRYYLTFRHTADGTLSSAMANRAAFTYVRPKPRPQSDQGGTDSDIADDTDVNDGNSDDTNYGFVGRQRASGAPTCVYRVGR